MGKICNGKWVLRKQYVKERGNKKESKFGWWDWNDRKERDKNQNETLVEREYYVRKNIFGRLRKKKEERKKRKKERKKERKRRKKLFCRMNRKMKIIGLDEIIWKKEKWKKDRKKEERSLIGNNHHRKERKKKERKKRKKEED